MSVRKKKLALVIGAGSVKCAAALGLWKVLEKENIHFDMIVGCSGGSIYAIAMAMGHPLEAVIEQTKMLWNRSITEKRNWRALASVILPQIFKFDKQFSMMSDVPLLKSFKSVFGEKNLLRQKFPFISWRQILKRANRLHSTKVVWWMLCVRVLPFHLSGLPGITMDGC